jgi:hypothetical protein
MSNEAALDAQADPDQLEAAVDQAIAACGGDMRATIKALILANEFLEASVSTGYIRSADRRDWYD